MSVHTAISKHSNQQYMHLQKFAELDEQRERYIDDAITCCKNNQPFSTDHINHITHIINEHAKHGISPTRKYVSTEMVYQFVKSSSN